MDKKLAEFHEPFAPAAENEEFRLQLPALFQRQGSATQKRVWEFFVATIRNRNTRQAYAHAVAHFSQWCEIQKLTQLDWLEPIHAATYIEQLSQELAIPSVKQHLAALRMLFDWLVTGQELAINPFTSIRSPRLSYTRGKTPVLSIEEARQLLDSIPAQSAADLRDRALIATMIYTFGRVSAVLNMELQDYFAEGKRWWVRLHEKGNKLHAVPAHHRLEEYLDQYLKNCLAVAPANTPLFRSLTRQKTLSDRSMSRHDALRMIKRRIQAAGLSGKISCHSFRATGITAYLESGGTIEKAQTIAAHASPRTTKLYDRSQDQITLAEIEKIGI